MNKGIYWLGEHCFGVLYCLLPKDKIVVWDSNGGSFAKDTFLKQKVLDGKTLLLTPGKKRISLHALLCLARAKVFVPNTNTICTKLLQNVGRGKTLVVNIWHGAGCFKKFGKDDNNIGVEEYHRRFGKPDYVVCSSEGVQREYSEAFGIEKSRILPFGTARSDLMFDQTYIEESKKCFFSKYPQLKGKRIYLYAPTWRGQPLDVNTAHFMPQLDFEKVTRMLREDEVIIVKNHILVIKNKTNNCNIHYNEKIICCDTEEIMCLLNICDVLITDFSSVYFDALIVNKPVLFYAEDVEQYTALNGLYEPYENYCPGELLTQPDPKKFVNAIRHSKEYIQSEKYQAVKKRFVENCDGHASERLASFLVHLSDL